MQIRIFLTLLKIPFMLSVNSICQQCDNSTRKQNGLYLKTRSIKTKKKLVVYKTVSNNNLFLTRNSYLLVFTEAAPEVERNKIK